MGKHEDVRQDPHYFDIVTMGPFQLPVADDGSIYLTGGSSIWQSAEREEAGLSDACGCYTFSMLVRGASVPWYVGKAERQSFKQECSTPDKRRKFSQVSQNVEGIPVLYLHAFKTPRGRFKKTGPSRHKRVEERRRITEAYRQNPKLINKHGVKAITAVRQIDRSNPTVQSDASKRSFLRRMFGRN